MTDRDRTATPLKVQRLMDAAFFPGRTSRSLEYRAGCRAALEFRFARQPLPMPYAAGTAAADAFFAGIDEGHAIWQRNDPTLSSPPSARPSHSVTFVQAEN